MSVAPRPGTAPLLELRALTKRFGAHAAVDRLSLAIGAGEFLTVLGASGSGKTTTLRLIAGFERATSGQILMDGVDLAGLPPFKRPINTVFQQYALFPHLNVRDNVAYGLRMQRVPEAEISTRVQQALEMVQLGRMGDRAPRTLSGGQQQRVALARALVNRPRVLLLDEPLGALDLKLRRAMQLELKQLQTRLAITFIYVTHDQEEALTMSDRIALMRDGRIEQLGTPRDMYDRPRTRYVADFIGETNLVPVTVASVDGATATLRAGEHTLCAPIADGAVVPGGAGAALGGKSAWLSVRPEAVSVVARANGSAFPCTLPATITGIVYAGSAVKVHLALDSGTAMVAQLPPGANVPTVGSTCLAAWSPERSVLVAE